jgi:hypothetical protein
MQLSVSPLIMQGFWRCHSCGDYNLIGNYWEAGNKNEIDIVAVNDFSKTALIAEVKRNEA